MPDGIAGLVLGIQSLKSSRKGMATAGVVLAVIVILASLVNGIAGAILAINPMEK